MMKQLLLLFVGIVLTMPIFAQIQWQKTIGGSDYDEVRAFQQTSDGGYILAGTSSSNISGEKNENSITNGLGQATWDIWVVKLDANGNIQYQNTIGGSDNDQLESIDQTSDGGYIIGATSLSGISGDKTHPNKGGGDYWIIKLNSALQIQNQKTYGTSSFDFLRSIEQMPNGEYIVAGVTNAGINGDKTQPSNGGSDIWILHLSANLSIVRQKSLGGNNDERPAKIKPIPGGGFIVAGDSRSNISGDKTENSIGLDDYWIVKLNNNLQVTAQNTIGGTNYEVLEDLNFTNAGGYIIGGYSSSGAGGDKISSQTGGWLLKLDGQLNIINQAVIEDVKTILQTNNNEFIAAGRTTGTGGWGDVVMTKIDNSLSNVLWTKALGGSQDERNSYLTVTSSGGYMLATSSKSGISEHKTDYNRGNYDYWLMAFGGIVDFHFEDYWNNEMTVFECLDRDIYLDGRASENETAYYIDAWKRPVGSSSSFQWAAALGWNTGQVGKINLTDEFANQGFSFNPGYEYQIKLAISNNPYFGWIEETNTFTVSSNAGLCGHPIDKERTFGRTTEEAESIDMIDAEAMVVFPNPSNGQFELANTEKINYFSILDLRGNTLLSESISPSKNHIINTEKLKSGMYILSVTTVSGKKENIRIVIR